MGGILFVTKRKYDFAGWVTKNDIKCSDGVTIKHDAFRENDGHKVPLVWNHDYNTPNNVLGHVLLENRDMGVYGYGYFNETTDAQNAKVLVQHGDISSMSIGARKLKRLNTDVIKGLIYEVSLVLAGANPGAMIDSVMQHSEDGEEEKAIITTGRLIHAADDVVTDNNDPEDKDANSDDDDSDSKDKESNPDDKDANPNDDSDQNDDKDPEDGVKHSITDETKIEEVMATMNEDQLNAVYALLGMVASGSEDSDDDQQKDDKGDNANMKHNVFSKEGTEARELQEKLRHSANDILKLAFQQKASSLKDLLAENEEFIQHGINSIEMLFPDAYASTNGNVPILFKDANTQYVEILNSINKTPFSRVKTMVADLTEEEARAKGYVKGNFKKEEFFSLIKRVTTPTTVYKKQKLDRDDIVDITDFDVVAFMNVEMQMMLKEELARAALVGDGRDFSSEEKINEQNIRPIISDHDFFTIKKNYASADVFIEAVIRAMSEYRGSGRPSMYLDPTLLADIKLLKDDQGRFLFGDIPSDDAIATRLGMAKLVPTTFMTGQGAIIVNLRDYSMGATKGGQVTNFDQFDIDYNQHKYLIETRLSGALTLPKSAIHLKPGASAGTGANDSDGGVTYGSRQADKTTTTTTTSG